MNGRDMDVLIVGGGRVGLRTATILENRGHDITIVERDSDRVEEIADEYVATVIEGDANKPSILKQAGIDQVDVLVALTGDLGTNLACCLNARQRESPPRTVMRRPDEQDDEYADAVDVTVFPEAAGGRVAANAIDSGVDALEHVVGDIEILVVEVTEEAPVAGRSLTDISLPRGSLVVSGADGNTIAGPDTTLVPGRTFIIAAERDVEDEIVRLFRG